MNDDVLQQLHQVYLEMMDEVDRICRKYDIPYFLDSGTALGAVRHGGFIPWDDDADLGMLREDYDRFLEIAEQELDPAYVIVTHEKEPTRNYWHAKIRKRNTLYPQKIYEGCQYQGIVLDVFPFDYVPDNEAKAIGRIRFVRFCRKICAAVSSTYRSGSSARQFLRACLGIVPEKYYRRTYEKMLIKYNRAKTGRLTSYTYRMALHRDIHFRAEDILPVKDVSFEDRTYRIMNNPDAYLRAMYGDYMQLPPEEQRVAHLEGEIIFDTTV